MKKTMSTKTDTLWLDLDHNVFYANNPKKIQEDLLKDATNREDPIAMSLATSILDNIKVCGIKAMN